jgi:hypothetical protein
VAEDMEADFFQESRQVLKCGFIATFFVFAALSATKIHPCGGGS